MNLNLNDPNEFTIRGVHRLLASKTGSELADEYPGSYQLRVTKNGTAYIKASQYYPTYSEVLNHAVLFAPWLRTDVGQVVASNDEWVYEVYEMLKRWWWKCLKIGPHWLGGAYYADYMP